MRPYSLGKINTPHAAILLGLWLSGCRVVQAPTPTAYSAPQPLAFATVEPLASTSQPGSQVEACVNQARFIEDLTIPDGSRVQPGELLDKRWAVLNSGNCNWGPGYRLIRADAGNLEAPGELALYPARAGEPAVWQVLLTAPRAPGEYLASWQARSPSGEPFGDPVFVFFEVVAREP